MNFDNIIDMHVRSHTYPVIHLINGLYVTCTSFIPDDNNGSMLFYYPNSNIPIEISGTYNNTFYTYNSDYGWGINMQ